MSDAAELVEQIAEKLKEPEMPPGYLKLAPAVNRAMKRAAARANRLRVKHFETWKRQLNAMGTNWEDVLAERIAKMKERARNAARPVEQDGPDGAAGGDSAEAGSAA